MFVNWNEKLFRTYFPLLPVQAIEIPILMPKIGKCFDFFSRFIFLDHIHKQTLWETAEYENKILWCTVNTKWSSMNRTRTYSAYWYNN